MKNKPLRHKADNTFKFQPFAERIANIDVDIFHRVPHAYEVETEEIECYFQQTLQKWNVLNLTDSYDKLRKEVAGIVTLPQLIHKKEYVVETLLKHLKLKNPLSLQPTLELVVSLSKDLQKDFYPFYLKFLNTLIEILNTKDTDVLEWMFVCLAYLFKNLWRYLLKDINVVFVSLLPLLSNKKPEYINNFAAESFAFVARKVKDRSAFLALILTAVQAEKDGITGCGKLLFEVINGVQNNFHSCAEQTLQFYFDSLLNDDLPQEILFDVLQQVLKNISFNIKPKNTEIFWKTLTNSIEKCLNVIQEKKFNNLSNLMELMIQMLEWKDGKYLTSVELLVKLYLKLIQVDYPENLLRLISKFGSLLLNSQNIQLPQENASTIVRKSLLVQNDFFKLDFIRNLLTYSQFEAMILPSFLNYFKNNLNDHTLKFLTEIIINKSQISHNGIVYPQWTKYTLDFGSCNDPILQFMLEILNDVKSEDSLHKLFNVLICLPHLKISKVENVVERLKTMSSNVLNEIDQNEGDQVKHLCLLANILSTLTHLMTEEDFYNFCFENNILDKLSAFVGDDKCTMVVLSMIDLILAATRTTEFISMKNLLALHEKLGAFFASPFKEVRLLVSHIYSLFDSLPELTLNSTLEKPEDWSVFSICYNVENIESLVQTYRDQLQNLQKLSYDKPQGILCKNTPFHSLPLKYLLGFLYINFQLVWEPVIGIIASYASGMPINSFWEVFSQKLFETDNHIKGFQLSEVNVGVNCDVINNLCRETYKVESTPDFVNYRQLLWKAMCEFPEIAEARNRDVAPLMLKFVDEEYRNSNASEALVWNIKKNTPDVEEEEEDTNDQSNEDENNQINEEVKDEANNKNEDVTNQDETKDDIKEPEEGVKFSKSAKTNLKTLLQQLKLFSKMRNPKNLHRQPELYKLYLDLLGHRNSEVQKVALDCIMVYKHKYLLPYKENLYNLIDDKKFKNELALFKIDKDDSTIQEIHRTDLIPFILKIVFSKMMVKTGLRTGGKAAGQMRRSMVLRFLAGCQENEMRNFVEMIFKYYTKFLMDDPFEMVKKVSSEIDLEKCISTKRLQSTLNLIQVILDQFGGLMPTEILTYVLKILFVIGATIYGVLRQGSNVHVGYLNSIKRLRSMALLILKRFFDQFDTYAWKNNEINALFFTLIWPSLDKLSIENVHSPTPMLKLLSTWCQNPRYYVLLVKSNVETGSFALKQIISLLLAEKIHPGVLSMLMEMFEKLLLLKVDENNTSENIPIETDDVLPVEKKILERLSLDEKLNYGSCILLPFVPQILQKLKKKLSNKHKGINAKETFILSRISELVWEPDMCDTVLALLLPVIYKKATSGASEEIILQLITTVMNLIKIVDKPQGHIKNLSPLFCEVTSSNGRKLLCDILKTIATKTKDSETKRMADIVTEINAFDARWIDQPDFERRLNGFKQVTNLVTEDQLDLNLGVVVIYNSFNFIKHEKDLALRESSDLCLRTITPHLITKFESHQQEKNYLINDILLDLIRRGINNKNEQYRHEAISLLGHIARECPTSHNVLSDLSKLSNKVDLEVDFFENLLHLQLYRQTRALNKFAQIYQEIKVAPNVRTLTQFILPLTSSYLLTEKFAQKNSLIDSSIAAVKTICKLLPWHQYESVLKFYLGKLRHKREFQKQLVKIVVAVLDAYHFDLTKAQVESVTSLPKEKFEAVKEVPEKKEEVEEKPEKSETEAIEDEQMFPSDDEEVEDEEEVEVKEEILPVNRITVLCPSAAKRVIHSISHVLLPQLNKTMAELTQHESSHKVNRKKVGIDHEEEELQKVPISLAVVKLLQRLPKQILDRNLPGIFMKLCSFFKSHLESVRRATREILQKIMISLGTDYLNLLLREMSSMLSRGFQVHVLVYTVHSILVCLKELYKPGDIDKCLLTVMELCKNDLFGIISEEKEVAKIGTKVSEAKSTKSFDTFQILAQFITEKCLMDLVLPLKDVLSQTHSFKIVNKVQESLRRIVLGLIDNTYISTNSLLMFAYGTSSESIPQFLSKNRKKKMTDEERERKLREKPDCYIIPAAPVGKSGIRHKNVCSNAETNSHLLVEFGLRLCYFMLKRDKVQNGDFISFLDPFVLVFKNCLTSRHVKMCTLTIQCLGFIVKYNIPSLKEHIKDITNSIFELLHKYAAAGLSKGDNFDLVVASFKTMAILVRDIKYYNIETDQLKALLLYAEQDLHDFERQATAFGLLKAIISRKLIIPEIHDVMKKVSELSITSDLPHVRQHCRQVFHQFLLDYPLGKKLDHHLTFYMSQLNYEDQPGRESALEVIQGIISSFPVEILKKQSGMFFVLLGARLVNDEAPECRKMVAKALQTMLERLHKTDRDNLFEIVKSWFTDQKISHRRLAAQLCGIFVSVEKGNFEKRLPEIIPDIIVQFSGDKDQGGPGRFVKVKPPEEITDDDEKDIKPQDHNLFQVLQMLLKICNHCPSLLKNLETIETLSTHIQTLLAYPHEWVRLGAAQFIGYVLSALDMNRLVNLLVNKKCEDQGYLYSDPQTGIKSLTLDLCDQLQAGAIKSELAEQVVKNLVFMARVLQNVPNSDKTDTKSIDLHWLTRRMRKIVNMEVVVAPKSTILRTEVFKWIAGVATTLEQAKIKEEVHNLLAPLVREMTTTEVSNAPLRQLAKEVATIIKKKVGNEEYIKTVSQVQMQLNVRRAERKRERKQLAITEPELVAKKKIKMHEKKKEAKKRKIEGFKGKKPMKKKRKVEVDDE